MTRALIAEDEPLLAGALKAELAQLWPSLDVIGVARNGIEALAMLNKHAPDVAFLDIRMPGMTGMEVAQALAEDWDNERPAPLLIFVTAYDEFAVKAFEHAAVDYLLKPVQTTRLAAALERVRKRLVRSGTAVDSGQAAGSGGISPVLSIGTGSPPTIEVLAAQLRDLLASAVTPSGSFGTNQVSASAEPLRMIRAGVGDQVRMIPIERVILLQATDKYVSVLTAEAESLIREPLKELIPRLDTSRFAQIHRSTVVNLDFVEAAVRDELGKVTLKLRGRPEKPVVSRLYTHLFRAM